MLRVLIIPMLVALAAPAGLAFAEPSKPAAGTPEAALLEALVALGTLEADPWLQRFCHTEALCRSELATASVRKYNLPAAQRLAPKCVKGDGDALEVTRVDGNPAKDGVVKLFVVCDPQGMPRPFGLARQGDAWKIASL